MTLERAFGFFGHYEDENEAISDLQRCVTENSLAFSRQTHTSPFPEASSFREMMVSENDEFFLLWDPFESVFAGFRGSTRGNARRSVALPHTSNADYFARQVAVKFPHYML